LGRVSHKAKGVSAYVYDSTAGAGTCIYVADTGIYTAHSDFGGRASSLQNWVTTESNADLNGHGTAVAGTAGSTTYGVAKLSSIFSLKVCDQNGNCNVSAVVAAIAFAASDFKNRNCPNGPVINLSLGGLSAGWQSVTNSVVAATQAGVLVVAAAGNNYANTQSYLPASAPGACAVGATDSNDAIATFSNWGSTVAVFAPGVDIESTYIGSTSATVRSSILGLFLPVLSA
jgi:subtilisin family serine protease